MVSSNLELDTLECSSLVDNCFPTTFILDPQKFPGYGEEPNPMPELAHAYTCDGKKHVCER